MARPKNASEANPGTQQDPPSGPNGQEGGPEGVSPEVQEQVRQALLKDESFLEQLMSTPAVQSRLQSDRDKYVHSQTLSLKTQLDEAQRLLAQVSQNNDPVMLEYRRLKEEGQYEEALALLENNQAVTERENKAREAGERAAAENILTRVQARPEFQDLSQQEWQQVYANAASEAAQQGRTYLTVDEYVGHATRLLRQKERDNVTNQLSDEQKKAIDDTVEARLKELGLARREGEGGPENLSGRRGGVGGVPTDEEVEEMSQEEWNALSEEAREAVLSRAQEAARR